MKTKIMLIAAHPDDAEIAMGGTISALTENSIELTVVDLTDGEPTPHGTPEIRKAETEQSSAILGITKRYNLGLPNREIQDTIENRKKLANLIRKHTPDRLFIHYWDDAHPDHISAHNLCMAARFYAKLTKSDMESDPHYPRKVFQFFSTHMRIKMQPSFIYDISAHFKRKTEALHAYKSQFHSNPANKNIFDAIEAENRYWGRQIGVEYGEPFYCKENIKISGTEALLSL